jgi:vibriolysin
MMPFSLRAWRTAVAALGCAAALTGSTLSALAADVVDLTKDGTALSKLKQLSLDFQGVRDADLSDVVRKALNFDTSADLRLEKRTQLPNGKSILRFQQTYQGVPVWGQRVLVTKQADGSVQALSGEAVYNFGLNFSAQSKKLSKQTALAKATEAARKLPGGDTLDDVKDSQVREVIYVGKDGVAVPAYEVSFSASSTSRPEREMRPFVMINTLSGDTLLAWDGVARLRIGTGPGGNAKTGRIEYGKGNAPFLDITKKGSTCFLKSERVWTEDMGNTTEGSGKPFSFKCPRNVEREVNGAYDPMNDAQFFGELVFQMYKSWYGVPPLKFPLHMRIHFGSNPSEAGNAFWNGKNMTFGDGTRKYYPLVSLDVAGHEISHGFTEQNSRLIYQGQSGAINEAFSDMAGKAAEFFASRTYGLDGPTPGLSLGGNILKKKTAALRYMCNPTKDGNSIAHVRDYKKGMDIHYTSGVFNRAFCLLSKSPGWDVKKAFDVFVVANQNFWRPDSSFMQAAKGVLLAADALEYDDGPIRAAFSQVGIETGGPPSSVSMPDNKTPISICSYLGDAMPETIETLGPSQSAIEMIQKIVDASGLVQNFKVSAAAIPNAAAVTSGGVRRILYNPNFIDSLAKRTHSRWAPISVLAHEIGHHLNGHSLGNTGSRPQLEIEADAFSGFILERLGAPLKAATAVISLLGSDNGSRTHPGRAQRLAAVTSGWNKACKKDPDCFFDPADEPGPLAPSISEESTAARGELLFDDTCDPQLNDNCPQQGPPRRRANEAILHQP